MISTLSCTREVLMVPFDPHRAIINGLLLLSSSLKHALPAWSLMTDSSFRINAWTYTYTSHRDNQQRNTALMCVFVHLCNTTMTHFLSLTSSVSSAVQPGCCCNLPVFRASIYSSHFLYPSSSSSCLAFKSPCPGVTSPIPIEKPRFASTQKSWKHHAHHDFNQTHTETHTEDSQRYTGARRARRDMASAASCWPQSRNRM